MLHRCLSPGRIAVRGGQDYCCLLACFVCLLLSSHLSVFGGVGRGEVRNHHLPFCPSNRQGRDHFRYSVLQLGCTWKIPWPTVIGVVPRSQSSDLAAWRVLMKLVGVVVADTVDLLVVVALAVGSSVAVLVGG